MKQFTNEIAEKIKAHFDSTEVKDAIAAIKAATDSDTGTFEMVITTENLDRYQEVISMEGWELDHYRSNPVVLWGHDHFTLPVGVTTSLDIVDGKMVAKGKFAPNAFAQEIRRNYDLGIIRASSVGFIEKERQGNLITKAELIEWSFVSVPANPYALSTLMKAGHDVNALVTKGFVHITKDADEVVPDTVEPTEPVEVPEVEEKKFNSKAIMPIVAQLRAAADALEALPTEELERTDDETEAEDEAVNQMREFDDKRRLLQQAATMVGEVLAEVRQATQTRRN